MVSAGKTERAVLTNVPGIIHLEGSLRMQCRFGTSASSPHESICCFRHHQGPLLEYLNQRPSGLRLRFSQALSFVALRALNSTADPSQRFFQPPQSPVLFPSPLVHVILSGRFHLESVNALDRSSFNQEDEFIPAARPLFANRISMLRRGRQCPVAEGE